MELKQSGGKDKHKHKHKYDDNDDNDDSSDSSSSSSSSSSSDLVFTFPTGKTYNDLVLTYYPTIYGVPNIILPTFISSFSPYVNVGILPNRYITFS